MFVGLFTMLPYGAYLDQSTEQNTLFANIKEYLIHIPDGENIGLVQDMDSVKYGDFAINGIRRDMLK